MKYIVSHQHRFVYFVVPKAACSSIKHALIPLLNIDTAPYERHNAKGQSFLLVHRLYDESEFQLTAKRLQEQWRGELENYFCFTFVRNPWDRLVSCYHNKITDKLACAEKQAEPPLRPPADRPDLFRYDLTFSEFAHAVCSVPDDEADIHFRSQHSILEQPGQPGELMVDFVGRFERLEKDFAEIACRLGLSAEQAALPHTMKSRSRTSRQYGEYYTPTLRDQVASRFARDIDLFGYSF